MGKIDVIDDILLQLAYKARSAMIEFTWPQVELM